MSQPKQRQPRELLTSIYNQCMSEWRELHWHNGQIVGWDCAALDAATEMLILQIGMPPDKPKRSYYGAKGSLSNPHR